MLGPKTLNGALSVGDCFFADAYYADFYSFTTTGTQIPSFSPLSTFSDSRIADGTARFRRRRGRTRS